MYRLNAAGVGKTARGNDKITNERVWLNKYNDSLLICKPWIDATVDFENQVMEYEGQTIHMITSACHRGWLLENQHGMICAFNLNIKEHFEDLGPL